MSRFSQSEGDSAVLDQQRIQLNSKKMILWLFLLCWGLISAQDTVINEQSTETQPDSPNMNDLLKKVDALMEKFRVMETNQQDIQTRLTEDETRAQASENQNVELSNRVTTPVIFSAAAGGGDTAIGPYNTDTTLVFRRVITNIGNAYNSATGVFAAPYAGIYHFTFFCHAGGERPVILHLMKNQEVILDIHDHKSSYDTADNGGNAVFLQLQQGDQVFIRLKANAHVWGGNYATTFSGFLVTRI